MIVPSFEQLSAAVDEARMTLTQAVKLMRDAEPEEIASLLQEASQILHQSAGDHEPVSLAFLEIGTAAARQCDSASHFLNFALNLGNRLCSERIDVRRGLELLEQALHQTRMVKLTVAEHIAVILEIAEAYLAHSKTIGKDYLDAANQAFRACLALSGQGSVYPQLLARSHHGLGLCHAQFGESGQMANAAEAIKEYEAALRYLNQEVDAELFSQVMHNLGNAWRNLPEGDRVQHLEKATSCLEGALELREKLGLGKRIRVTCRVLADVEFERGRPVRAVALLEQALETLHPVHDRAAFARAQAELAKMCRDAWPMTFELNHSLKPLALACSVAARDACSPDRDFDTWASATAGLAAMLDSTGGRDRGIELRRELLAHLDPVQNEWRRSRVAMDQAQVLAQRATIWHADGLRAKTLQAYEEVAALVEWIKTTNLAEHRKRIAMAALARLEAAMTGDSAQRALARQRELSLIEEGLAHCSDETDVREVMLMERAALQAAADVADDEILIRLANSILAREAAYLRLSPSLAAYCQYAKESRETRDILVKALIRRGEVRSAWSEADRIRGRALDLLTSSREPLLIDSDLEVAGDIPPEVYTRHAQLVHRWVANSAKYDVDAGLRRDILAPQLRESLIQAARWRGQWAVNSPKSQPEPVIPMQEMADTPTAVIEFWSHKSEGAAFLFLPGETSPRLVQLPGLTTNRQITWVSQWYEAYSAYESSGTAALPHWAELMNRIAAEIGEVCWQPIRQLIEPHRVKRIVMIPDSLMDGLPLQSMTLGDHANTCIGDLYDICFSPSARQLARSLRGSGAVGDRALFFGDAQAVCPTGGCGGSCSLALPQANSEMEALRGHWPSLRVLRGSACTQNAVLGELRAFRPELIHASVHGVTWFHDPLGSGLVMAAEDRFSPDPLTVYVRHELTQVWGEEVAGEMMTLDTVFRRAELSCCRLAFLNACETALSPVSWASESLSLAAGFLAAGVPSVIAPIWPVADIVCGLLTERFYTELRAQPHQKARSLSSAQRWLRSLHYRDLRGHFSAGEIDAALELSDGDRPFSHMFFWAPLRLLGSPI